MFVGASTTEIEFRSYFCVAFALAQVLVLKPVARVEALLDYTAAGSWTPIKYLCRPPRIAIEESALERLVSLAAGDAPELL